MWCGFAKLECIWIQWQIIENRSPHHIFECITINRQRKWIVNRNIPTRSIRPNYTQLSCTQLQFIYFPVVFIAFAFIQRHRNIVIAEHFYDYAHLFPLFRFQYILYDDTSSSINVNNKSLCEMDVHEMRIKSTTKHKNYIATTYSH